MNAYLPTQTRPPSPVDEALNFYKSPLTHWPGSYDTLCLVIDTSLVIDRPQAIGTLIDFISRAEIRRIFKEWGEVDATAQSIARLGEAIASIGLPRGITPLANSKAGKQHFHGSLEQHYLLALLAERLPDVSKPQGHWLALLRAWFFIHAITRGARGLRMDENLQILSRGQRMACDNSETWLQFFAQLQPAIIPKVFRELNFRLHSSAFKQLGSENFKSVERRTLNAICELAANQDKPFKTHFSLPPVVAIRRYTPAPSSPLIEAAFEGQNAEVLIDCSDGTQLVVETPPPEYTPATRKLSARTLLFASAEEDQILPWGKNVPNPVELKLLQAWIDRTLEKTKPDSQDALGALYFWAAMTLGRSLIRTLALEITRSIGEEWGFDPVEGNFKRLPPMRTPGWLPDTEEALSWITPAATSICVLPPRAVGRILKKAHQLNPQAKTLSDLWPENCNRSPEQTLKEILATISPRLTGTMLGKVLAQKSLAQTHDTTFAKLISSHPQTPLGGAYSYAQWTLQAVTEILSPSTRLCTPTSQHIGQGSRLAVIDNLLSSALKEAQRKIVESRKHKNFIDFHNRYTAYTLIGLLAATGARPVNSPFESLAHFDFNENLVFIDDKHGGTTQRTGRVIPLPIEVSTFLQKRYLPHLTVLAHKLRLSNPGLSQQILHMLSHSDEGAIPLFFFLDAKHDWYEATPSSIFQRTLLDCPLPTNLFRHRLTHRLRAHAINSEIIDGIMGHSEWGNETWGYLSFRNWHEDAQQTRPVLSKIFSALRLKPLRGLSKLPETTEHSPAKSQNTLVAPRRFGAQVREIERRRRYVRVVRDAEFTIREFLAGRPLENLNDEALDTLADRLTRTENGTPISTGGLRLALLIRKLERIEKQTGTFRQPRKERAITSHSPSLFSPLASGAIQRIRHLKTQLDTITTSSKKTKRIAALLALAVESRIADPQMLSAIAQGLQYRVIFLQQSYYIEFGTIGDNNDVAGRRFPISKRTAAWLGDSRNVALDTPISADVARLWNDPLTSTNTLKHFIHALAELAEQANALTFPGVVCGILAGKTETTALGWHDLMRMQCGKRISLSGESQNLDINQPLRYRGDYIAETGDKQTVANSMLRDSVRTTINRARAALPGSPKSVKDPRSKLDSALKKGIQQGASAALLLLVQWLLHLLDRKNGKKINTNTLARYWGALSARFRRELTDFNLLHADSEEITEAYTRVLLCNQQRAPQYTLERLAQFHRWVSRHFDIAEPNWGELPIAIPGQGVSPGYISNDEYQRTLDAILDDKILHTLNAELPAALILLMAYRFGLRRSEAIFLTYQDWIDDGDNIILNIQSNRWRKLKTLSSQRQVPLLFQLSEKEKCLIERAKLIYTSRHGNDTNFPLVQINTPDSVLARVQAHLKAITGNPATTLHHARHTVANLLLLKCLGIKPGAWRTNFLNDEARQKLLGGDFSASRRHAWAISRFLGHASPKTSIKSYIHFISEWLDEMLALKSSNTQQTPQGVVHLEHLPEAEAEVTQKDANPEIQHYSLQQILSAYRLFTRKISCTRISSALNVPEPVINCWLEMFDDDGTPSQYYEITHGINENAWQRIIQWAGFAQKITPSDMAPHKNHRLEMIGLKHQLLAAKESHFFLLKKAFDTVDLSGIEYKIYGSSGIHAGTRTLAEKWGFSISERHLTQPRDKKTKARPVQIDTMKSGPFKEGVLSRVALIFEENNQQPIRNRNELILVVLAIGTLFASTQPN